MNTNHQLATLALRQYGLEDAQLALSQDKWNITYCVTGANGQKYNLRICGAAMQDAERIHDEMIFLDFVAQRGQIRVPKPVRNVDGEFVTTVEADERRICCLFEWIEGDVVRDALTDSVMHKMGRATAFLHQAAHAFRFPTPDDPFRRGYDYDEAVILQHREWMAALGDQISPERRELLNRAIDHVLAQFAQIPKHRDTYGFIHADLNPNNFVVTNVGLEDEEVSVIDFEQLGRGYFCIDFANMKAELLDRYGGHSRLAVSQNEGFMRKWNQYKAGYQTISSLPFTDEAELDPFIMTVDLNFLDWIYNTPTLHVREQYDERFQATHELIRLQLETKAT
ncbi:MAG: phosphotransferase [Chloroflexota bacterium]